QLLVTMLFGCSFPHSMCSNEQEHAEHLRLSISAIMDVLVLCIHEVNAEALFVGRWKGFMNHDARIILRLILNLSFPATLWNRRSVVCLSYQVKKKRQKLLLSNLM
ncbi:hypothetical protein ZWY2020_058149, partial [Hordeum vulgare]